MAATFTGMGRGKAGPKEQFRDAPGEDTEEEFPLVLEDAEQPKKGKPGTSKSKGKQLGDQPAQAAEGAEAPPEETPPDPNPTKPHTYIETEEEKEKPKYVFTRDAKLALTDYYNAVHTLSEAQQNFAKSIQVLEKKIEDKSIFRDIIKQVQLPLVQVQVRTVEEMEKMEGKTYRELTLMCHLPNFKRINPNAKEQTRMMAAYIYFILYEQITGIRASQTGCATDFRCPTMPFKRLITGKKQPSRPGRSSEVRGGSSRSLEEVTEMEGPTPTKRTRKASKSATATTSTPKGRGLKRMRQEELGG